MNNNGQEVTVLFMPVMRTGKPEKRVTIQTFVIRAYIYKVMLIKP